MKGRQNLVVYIGLSASGVREAHELSLLGNRVLLVGPSRLQGHVHVNHRNFDLAHKSDISTFSSSLGLSGTRLSAGRRAHDCGEQQSRQARSTRQDLADANERMRCPDAW